jgi:hypothetical protein
MDCVSRTLHIFMSMCIMGGFRFPYRLLLSYFCLGRMCTVYDSMVKCMFEVTAHMVSLKDMYYLSGCT